MHRIVPHWPRRSPLMARTSAPGKKNVQLFTSVMPSPVWYVPAMHDAQLEYPSPVWNVPGPHKEQLLGSIKPIPVEYFPGPQREQLESALSFDLKDPGSQYEQLPMSTSNSEPTSQDFTNPYIEPFQELNIKTRYTPNFIIIPHTCLK